MINLKAEYGARFRIVLDESAKCGDVTREERLWLFQIPCRYGHVFVWSRTELGAHCDRRGVIPRLIAIPGVMVRQRGDREVNISFDPAIFDQIAEILHPRKRPALTEERREQLRQRMASLRARLPISPDKTGGKTTVVAFVEGDLMTGRPKVFDTCH